jgi:proliferating cell nuclear antigen
LDTKEIESEKEKVNLPDFKARIECSLLRGIVASVRALGDEAKIYIDKKDWKVTIVDPTRVAVLTIKVATKNFEEYKCKVTGYIGVDIDKLMDCLRHNKDRDIIDISIKENKIIIDSGPFTRRMCQVDTSGMSEPKIPNLNLKSSFSMTWADFQGILKRMNSISDRLSIGVYPGGMEFTASNDADDIVAKYGSMSLVEFQPGPDVKDEAPAKSLFPLDYLQYFFSNSTKTGTKAFFNHERWLNVVKFKIGSDYPIVISAERNGLELEYMLAPRIEST